MKLHLCLTGTLLLARLCVPAQSLDSTLDKISNFPNRLFAKIQSKEASLDQMLTRQTEKYLEKLAANERKLHNKLAEKDSAAAKNNFAGIQEKYLKYEQEIKSIEGDAAKPLSGEYLPYVDSLKGTLTFLNKYSDLTSASSKVQNQIAGSLQQFNQLQSRFELAGEIREFIRQRKQILKDLVDRYSNSLGVNHLLDEYNKQAYYYSQQIREYRDALNDPDKLEQKALYLLNKLPAFQQFMKNNSQLAGLFNIPGDYGSPQAINGLQTRDQVMQLIQNQVGSSGGGMAAFQQNLSEAHQELDNFKEKLNQLGGGSGEIDMPKFKPNNQKTKPFLKRLELGTNLQTTRSNYFFPTTTDIGISIGYIISNKGTIGIGGSYKIGWGTDINHIHVTSVGASIRSFFDLQMKKSLYASGGFEYNYQQAFSNFRQIASIHDWQQSGLIGISKMVSFTGKIIKKTKLQILWDFLSYYQIPRTQAFKFRVGYNF